MSDISEKVLQAASSALTCFKDRRLLIHCITNYVTVNDCANALLAAGPSPVMSHDPGEAALVTASADALVLNLGATEYLTAIHVYGSIGKYGTLITSAINLTQTDMERI